MLNKEVQLDLSRTQRELDAVRKEKEKKEAQLTDRFEKSLEQNKLTTEQLQRLRKELTLTKQATIM